MKTWDKQNNDRFFFLRILGMYDPPKVKAVHFSVWCMVSLMGRLMRGDIVLLEMETAGLEPKRFLL